MRNTSSIMGMCFILPKKLAIRAIGASRSASLATCDAPSPQRIDIRLGSKHRMLRRYHLRSAPIAISGRAIAKI